MATKKQRYLKIQERVAVLFNDLDQLRDEMQEAYDNMPESLQDGVNGEKMYARIEAVEEQLNNLEEITEYDWSEAS